MMSRLVWGLVDFSSRLLAQDECEAVRGDLAEAGVSGGAALVDILGLVARRQAALWLDGAPWLALAGIVVPLGVLLSHVSRWWAYGWAIDAFIYLNRWTWAMTVENPGFRGLLVAAALRDLVSGLALIGWSWTSGFALGALSRRTLWITAPLFLAVVLGATVGTTTTARANELNAAVFEVPLYGVLFPRLLRALFVLLPAWLGMRRSLRQPALSWRSTAIVAGVIIGLTWWAGRGLELAMVFGRQPVHPGSISLPLLHLLPLVAIWPAGFMVATAIHRRVHHRSHLRIPS